MNTTLVRLLLSCAAAGALAAGPIALAQAPAPPAPATAAGPPPPPMAAAPPPPPGTYNPAQLPQTQGTVQRFTLTPIGEIDGVILADGTEVHLPPHLTAEIAAAVRIGDRVIVRGYRSPYLPLVVAALITDTNTGRTVVDTGPPPPGSRPPPPPPGTPAPGAQQASVFGKVQRTLYGPAGDVNGAVLDNGTIVRIGPREAYQVAPLLAAGQTLAVQGWQLTTPYGTVVAAQAVGPSPGQLTQVAPPPPPGFAYAPPPAPGAAPPAAPPR